MGNTRLADIAIPSGLQTGPFGSQLKASEYVPVGVPVVMPQDIRGGRISLDKVARVSEAKATSLHRHRLHGGDILFARRGDLAKIALIGPGQDGWLCGTGCLRVRVDTARVEPRFVLQYLALPKTAHWLQSNALGQTMLNLNTEIVGQLPIPLPSLDEQRRIADILATWDAAIEKTELLIEKKARLFSGVQSALIVAPAESKGCGREHLGDLAVITKGQQLNVSDMMDAGSNYVLNGGTGPSGRTSQWNTLANTITISEGGNSCGHVTFNVEPFWCGGHCYALKNLSKRIEVRYLYHALKSQQDRLMSLRVGSGLPNIQIKDVRSFLVAVPSLPEQRRIAQRLDTAEREMDVLGKLGQAFAKQKVALGASLIPPHDDRVEP